ncbi:hypothetical protein ACFY4C_20325 [Actinomadura viridis]|uniref:hypothetical protein n=1 Tax=Actinomadura viridis TaxID=58110 RepID=UPI0036B48753
MTAPTAPEVQELAAAIREAMTVPVADSRVDGGRLAEEMLRLERMAQVRGALASLSEGTSSVSAAAETIRDSTAHTPVTYTPYEPKRDGGAR